MSYSHDGIGRLIQANAPEGTSRAFYDLAGNRVRHTAANGVVTDAIFDNRDRPTQLSHKTAGGALLQSYATAYLPTGRRSQTTELDGAVEAYAYDANGRLASEARTGSNPRSVTHTYDAVGNRLQRMAGATPTTFSYDTDDRLLSDGTATYAWDANGNMVSKTQGASVTQYSYDAEDRLVSISGGGLANQYAYDADGNRIRSSNSTATTRFLLDTANNTGLSQVLEERDGSGALQARYSYGNELLAITRGGNTSFQIHDSFGSTRALADGAGTMTDGYQYDAFGSALSTFGTTVNPYRYRGERLDADSELYQLRARYYAPGQGRFLTRDPFGGRAASPISLHRYAYGDSDPVNNIDPTGQSSLAELSVVQALSGTLRALNFGSKLVAGCAVQQTLEQVQDLAFGAVVGIELLVNGGLIANGVSKFLSGHKPVGVDSLGFAGSSSSPIINLVNPIAKSGSLKAVSLNFISSGSSGGINLGFAVAGATSQSARTLGFSFTAPPFAVKVAGGGTIKGFSKKFGCALLELGEISTELSGSGYEGADTKNGFSAGVGAALSLKFSLFHGHYNASLPLLGINFGASQNGGFQPTITLGGIAFGVELNGRPK